MGRLFALKDLIRTGRLTLRLMKDPRVPIYAKVVPAAALLYALSPLDFLPDWIPILGQLDDLAALAAGLSLFIRLCPPEVVEEHEIALRYRPRSAVEGSARPVPPSGPGGPTSSASTY
jgi:uncharacterized membrane protein YkvA (DUF1232 family)